MAKGVKVRLLGDDADLQKTLKGASVSVAKWSAATVAAAALAGAAMTKSGLDSADALAKQAQQLETTSKDLLTMQRAAEMAGVSQEKMASASRALTTRLAQAAGGTGTAVAALEKLGLQTDDLEGMTLSEKIKTLNDALVDNVAVSERAAVAAQLYGEEAGLAVGKISGGTIETATEQIKKFNAGLSEIDAAKIENANDTVSQMGIAFDSITQQMAAQVAPVLDSVAGRIFDAAAETDLFKTGIETAFNAAVTGAGFVADAFKFVEIALKGVELAFDGVLLVSSRAVRGIVASWDDVGDTIAEKMNSIIRSANRLPGIDMAEIVTGESEALQVVKKWSSDANESFSQTRQELSNLVGEEMPSTAFKAFIADAQAAGQAAAEAAVKSRESAGAIDVPKVEGIAKSTKDEQTQKELESRLESIRQANLTEQELAAEKLELDLEALASGNELKLLSDEEYLAQKMELQKRYDDEATAQAKAAADKQIAIETAAAKAKLNVASSAFGNLSSLMLTENKKLFEIGKVAALAQATIDGYAAIQSSYAQGAKVGGPAVGAAFAATAAVATAVQISNIASTSFGGGGSVSAPGGGGNPEVANGGAGSNDTQAQSVNLNLTGDTFSRQSVTELIEQINEAVADGAVIRVS